MNVVINKCYGGFGLSHQAVMRYAELSGFSLYPFTEARDDKGQMIFDRFVAYEGNKKEWFVHYAKSPLTPDGKYINEDYWCVRDLKRNDFNLLKIVEELGEAANGECAKLHVVEIPDGVDFEIQEYDGFESIHERHRVWG